MNHVVGYGTYDYLNLFRSENGGESLEQIIFFRYFFTIYRENTGFTMNLTLETIDSGSNFEFIEENLEKGSASFTLKMKNRTWDFTPLLDGDGSSRVVKSEILDDGTYAEEVYLSTIQIHICSLSILLKKIQLYCWLQS